MYKGNAIQISLLIRYLMMRFTRIFKRLKVDQNRYNIVMKIKQVHTDQIVTRFIVSRLNVWL